MKKVDVNLGRTRAKWAGVAASAVVLSVTAAGCSLSSFLSASDHAIYSGEVGAVSQVDSVSRVAWEWDAPEGYLLRDVLSGVGGAVMVLSDGVVGLAGATGEELWHYRVPDDSLESAAVTPEGKSVVLAYQGEDEGDLAVVVLDAGTGELRGEYPARTGESEHGRASNLTENARLSHPGNGSFGLSAASLETGEPLWEFEGQIPEEAEEFHVGEVVVATDAVVLSAAFKEGSPTATGSGEGTGQMIMSVVGLDAETGALLWEEEFSFAVDEVEQPQYTLSEGGEVLLLEVGHDSSGAGEQWLLNPLTGEELPGTAFSGGEEWQRVAFLGDGYVETAQDMDQVQYRVKGFDGSVREHVEVVAWPGEGSIHPGVITGEGVLRLDYLTEGELSRGEVEAEFLSWSSGESRRVPVDLSSNESLLLHTEGSINADADAPRLVRVPGAVVVAEEYELSVRAVGLS